MASAAATQERPFLKRPETVEALAALSDAEDLTIVVGAGASAEAGLPDWRTLVEALLSDLGVRAGAPAEEIERFTSWSIRADGLPGAGAVAKAWLEDGFTDAIRRQLYAEVGDDPRPGPTSLCVAELYRAARPGCEIVTQNYDKLLERALNERGGFLKTKVRSYVIRKDPPSDCASVTHLHGVLTPKEEKGVIVLSESDYHLMQDKQRWQEQYMRSRLQKSTCLFVGSQVVRRGVTLTRRRRRLRPR